MTLIDRTINTFEKRVEAITKITNITKLPQWTDVDVICVNCLLTEYRKRSSHNLRRRRWRRRLQGVGIIA